MLRCSVTVVKMPAHSFGRQLRSLWHLDPNLTYLNHGTVGATPRAVLAHQQRLMIEIERNPAKFILRELNDRFGSRTDTRIRTAAARVAAFVGAQINDVALVDNITTAANGVLRSFRFHKGDEIVATSLGYGGVTNVAAYAARTTGATLRIIELPLPGQPEQAYVQAVIDQLGDNTRMLIIDHITAQTGLVLPVREIAAACKTRDILVFVDGAHAPGNIALNVPSLGVDYYAANLHKWAMAPRSTGFLWVTPERQAEVHAPIISWGLDNGLAAEFDGPGTRDPSALLTVPFALDYLAELGATYATATGGSDGVLTHNHNLAWSTGRRLAEAWNVSFTTPESMIGAMVTVRLPERLGRSADAANAVNDQLFAGNIEIPIFSIQNELFLRVSAQIYCDGSDIDRLLEVVDEIH
jgi:isopenicillin-N epimerase